MAYGKKYILPFKNRKQNDIYRIEVLQKDYADSTVTVLEGSETPVIVEWTNQDIKLNEPINPLQITISFITNTIEIEDFYSNDDEAFRVDFYFQSFGDGTGTEKLLYTTFLVQDGVTESVTDQKHIISLKSTDNLALLKNITLKEARPSDYNNPFLLWDYIREALQETGLYSSIDAASMPLTMYNNLFENTTDDRSIDDTNDPFRELILYSNTFQSDNETFDDLYTTISEILGAFNASLLQASGSWVLVRIPEYQLFSGEVPGTELTYSGGEVETAVALNPLVTIGHNTGDCYPIKEDQVKSLQRSIRYDQNTFNYTQPEYIRQSDLQIAPDAVPYDTNTVGDLRYDDYDLATYFPYWVQRDGDTSYLEVVTDTVSGQETDRYIVTPSPDDTTRGVQFNPIAVSKGDKVEFSLQFKTLTDTDDELLFDVRFILISQTGVAYTVIDVPPIGSPDYDLIWSPIPVDEWDDQNGLHRFISSSVAASMDTTIYQQFSFSGLLAPEHNLPLIPEDSMLLIQVCGTNSNAGTDNQTTAWNSPKVEITNFITQGTLIVGQIHNNEVPDSLSKKVESDDILIDDSPRHSISGTLFTNALTDFEYTDTITGEDTDIGEVYFTKTTLWHRGEIEEARRLGDIITAERLTMKQNTRLIIDGTFRNVRYGEDKFISPLCLFDILFYEGSHFVASSMSIDYMNCTFNARLIEIYNDADIIAQEVYLYGSKNLETGIIDGFIHFDTINYYNGADDYLVPSDSNSKFTYAGFTTTLDISVIFYVPISGSGTATFAIGKNGVPFAFETVDASEHFKRIDFLLTEPVTNGDYFQVAAETGGATVDIQSGSINLTVNNALSDNFDYLFKFKYDVKR